jgi:uncharacterized membrane protein YqjE
MPVEAVAEKDEVAMQQSGLQTVVVGLLRDIRMLLRQEMTLARHEFESEMGKILKAVLWFGTAVVMAVIGLFTITAACVLLLYEYTGLPAWVCAAIMSAILLSGTGGIVIGRRVIKSVRVVPLQAARTLWDDLKWIAERVRTSRG